MFDEIWEEKINSITQGNVKSGSKSIFTCAVPRKIQAIVTKQLCRYKKTIYEWGEFF